MFPAPITFSSPFLPLLFLSQTVQPRLPQLPQPALRRQWILHQPSFCREQLREHKLFGWMWWRYKQLLQNLHLWSRSNSQMERQMRRFRFVNNAHRRRRRLRDSARVEPHRGLRQERRQHHRRPRLWRWMHLLNASSCHYNRRRCQRASLHRRASAHRGARSQLRRLDRVTSSLRVHAASAH